jgi:uncharacterized protein YvpB
MHQLLVVIATATPTEVLVDKLEESIKEWKIFKDDNRLKNIVFNAHLIILKDITEGKMDGAMKVINDMDKLNDYRKMFENKES